MARVRGRFQLLNRLAAEVPEERWLLVCDDDVEFPASRRASTFLALAAPLRLDLAQPAHAKPEEPVSDRITGRRPLSPRGCETTFVEIGPVLRKSPRPGARVIPFPRKKACDGALSFLLWYDLQREACASASSTRHQSGI